MAYFNRFDVAEAWYLYLRDYHKGQWGWQYRRLCKLRERFSPKASVRENGAEGLSRNGREIYREIVERAESEAQRAERDGRRMWKAHDDLQGRIR